MTIYTPMKPVPECLQILIDFLTLVLPSYHRDTHSLVGTPCKKMFEKADDFQLFTIAHVHKAVVWKIGDKTETDLLVSQRSPCINPPADSSQAYLLCDC